MSRSQRQAWAHWAEAAHDSQQTPQQMGLGGWQLEELEEQRMYCV